MSALQAAHSWRRRHARAATAAALAISGNTRGMRAVRWCARKHRERAIKL